MRAPARRRLHRRLRPAPPLLLLLLLLLARGVLSEPLGPVPGAEEESAEEEELLASLEAAEPPEGCCVRLPRIEPLHDGEGGSVDVGHCSRNCRRSFMDAEADAEADASEEVGACPGAWACETSRAALRAEAGAGGEERELRVVEGCACRPRAALCARRPLALRLFPDTPFETTVDVGACAGRCPHGGCRAVQRRSVAVQGPNGARCVPVVERCACVEACFRVRRLRVVRDYAGEDGALLKQPVLKEVDVGACEGSCEGVGEGAGAGARRCADPFWRAPAPCRSWLVERRHGARPRSNAAPACGPARTSARHYTTRDGERRRLRVVERCGCA